MTKRRHTKRRQQKREEQFAAWIAGTLLVMFVVTYLASLLLACLEPKGIVQKTLEQWLIALLPLVTLAVQWYLRQRGRTNQDE